MIKKSIIFSKFFRWGRACTKEFVMFESLMSWISPGWLAGLGFLGLLFVCLFVNDREWHKKYPGENDRMAQVDQILDDAGY